MNAQDHTAPRSLAGACDGERLDGGVLRLRARTEPRWALYLKSPHTDERAAAALAALLAGCERSVAWTARGGALLRAETAGGTRSLEAAAAVLHEPLPDLYAGLPLARYDEGARRFWTRVMRLARWPGGIWLIGRLARRRRASAAATL